MKIFKSASLFFFVSLFLSQNILLPVYAWPKEQPQDRILKAIEKKDAESLLKSLQAGVSAETQNKEGQKLLHLAARTGDTQSARLLLKFGAPVDGVNKLGETPLMLAAIERQLEMVKLLYRYEAQINPATDWSPLCYAAAGGSVPVIEFLIQNGADLDHRCINGISPLMMAIRQNQNDAALYLLNQGASAIDQSVDGKSVWQWAKEHQQKPIMEKLKSMHLNEE